MSNEEFLKKLCSEDEELNRSARTLFDFYQAHIKAGFTSEQAFELIKIAFGVMMAKGAERE